jgi:protein-S-isoprenylcysteine O-methyltransferase Ste14
MSEPSPELEQKHAGVVVPPPLIYAGTLMLTLAIDYAIDGPGLGIDWMFRMAMAVGFVVLGLAIALIPTVQFKQADTDVRPWKPSTALVTTGVYRYTRNPMYVGMSLLYAGLALFADSVIALAFLPALIALITQFVIKREEHYLEITFGEDYRAYKQRVRRWV